MSRGFPRAHNAPQAPARRLGRWGEGRRTMGGGQDFALQGFVTHLGNKSTTCGAQATVGAAVGGQSTG